MNFCSKFDTQTSLISHEHDCFSVEISNQFSVKRPSYTKLCNIFFHLKAIEVIDQWCLLYIP